MASFAISCTNCGHPYPDQGLPYICSTCGGIFDFSAPWIFDRLHIDKSLPGIWKYMSTFGLPEGIDPVSLGEGDTPLIWSEVFGQEIAFKCEHQNPTGSFKDRGSAVITGWLEARGVHEIIEDSSGNAGASIAAYAAHAGIKARIYIPDTASGVKRKQIENLGAECEFVRGTRSTVTEIVRQIADSGVIYASHAYLPFNIPGYATIAYEIYEQLGERMPGSVIVPVGQGGLLLGLRRGFNALWTDIRHSQKQTGEGAEKDVPIIVGVQASACSPLWASFTAGREGLNFVAENHTLAEGIKVCYPVRGESVLNAITLGNQTFRENEVQSCILAVNEEDILRGRDELALLGFYVEPTSAVVWGALNQIAHSFPSPIIVILTGSGYKYDGKP